MGWSHVEKKVVLASSLTEEEIMKNFEDVDLFTELMQALEDVLAFEQGKPDSSTTTHYM